MHFLLVYFQEFQSTTILFKISYTVTSNEYLTENIWSKNIYIQ